MGEDPLFDYGDQTMNYVFHDNQLFFQGEKVPSLLPDHSYLLMGSNPDRYWLYKHKRQEYRPVNPKHIPKEIRLLCLILNIPIQG